MEELKFPEGKIPQDKHPKMSMDQYRFLWINILNSFFLNRKNASCKYNPTDPVPVRFVIRKEDKPYFANPPKS